MRAKLLTRQAAQEREIEVQGIPVVIEHEKGSTRTGTNQQGEQWERLMHARYGYIPGTFAKGDNEDLDVYIGPDADAPTAYVVEQLKDDGSFDENKVMLGFNSPEEARETYLKHYPEGWEATNLGDITPLGVARLADMVGEVLGTAKTASYLTEDDARQTFRDKILPQPYFQQAIQELGGGKSWDELDEATQWKVCVRADNIQEGRA